jgi:hypothetical protein
MVTGQLTLTLAFWRLSTSIDASRSLGVIFSRIPCCTSSEGLEPDSKYRNEKGRCNKKALLTTPQTSGAGEMVLAKCSHQVTFKIRWRAFSRKYLKPPFLRLIDRIKGGRANCRLHPLM